MNGFEWLENEDLYGPVTKEHITRVGTASTIAFTRLIDYIAWFAAVKDNNVLLRYALNNGYDLYGNLLWNCSGYKCERILVDAGYSNRFMSDSFKPFINSRNSARLAAILTMRAIRQKGSIYRDPARMVGRAIWASRAYYLECVEESVSQNKKK